MYFCLFSLDEPCGENNANKNVNNNLNNSLTPSVNSNLECYQRTENPVESFKSKIKTFVLINNQRTT